MREIGRVDPKIASRRGVAGPSRRHGGGKHERSVLVRAEKLLAQVDQDETCFAICRRIAPRHRREFRELGQPIRHLDPHPGPDMPPIDAIEAGYGLP
jgi:hypothetical protein